MPKQTQVSGLLKKLGNAGKQGFDENKDKPPEYGSGGDLPDGINGGIAKLVDCKFDQYKQGNNVGKLFFYAAGVVVQPKEHNGIRIEGLRTSIMEPLFDDPKKATGRKTVQEHMGWILNELKKLGVDTSGMSYDSLESTVEALKEAAPYFRFRTWKGQKATTGQYAGQEPRVQHTWSGAIPDYTEDEDSQVNAVDDQVEETPEEPEADETPAEDTPDFDEADLTSLAKKADNKKDKGAGEAQKRLTEMAESQGWTEDEISGADNWTAVAQMIRDGKPEESSDDESSESEEESEEQGEEEAQEFPYVGAICAYKPKDPKTKKPGKSVQCEITSIDKKTKTANLKNLDTEKPYMMVPLKEITPVE